MPQRILLKSLANLPVIAQTVGRKDIQRISALRVLRVLRVRNLRSLIMRINLNQNILIVQKNHQRRRKVHKVNNQAVIMMMMKTEIAILQKKSRARWNTYEKEYQVERKSNQEIPYFQV